MLNTKEKEDIDELILENYMKINTKKGQCNSIHESEDDLRCKNYIMK
jgi:hypothetical protein